MVGGFVFAVPFCCRGLGVRAYVPVYVRLYSTSCYRANFRFFILTQWRTLRRPMEASILVPGGGSCALTMGVFATAISAINVLAAECKRCQVFTNKRKQIEGQ